MATLSDLLTTNFVISANDAASLTYDNSTSGLTATDVQAAIDEVDSDVDTISADLNQKASTGKAIAMAMVFG